MLQTFSKTSNSRQSAPRIATLRAELGKRGLDGFVVPHADEYQNEYLPPHVKRLAWLTGFTGSAGIAIVFQDKAVIFVDGRYTLQVKNQIDAALFNVCHLIEMPLPKWVEETLSSKMKLGYDPKLHTVDDMRLLQKACDKVEVSLVACETNPIDAIWSDQPTESLGDVLPHDIRYAGKSSNEKREELADVLREDNVGAAMITSPPSIAWLLNIRGQDVQHAPLPLCYAILRDTGKVDLFIEPKKVTKMLPEHLGNEVTLREPTEFMASLEELGKSKTTVQFDPAATSIWIADQLKSAGADVVHDRDPCVLPKAIKNEVELTGARKAHKRDGVALTRFLAWLSTEAPKETLDEIKAVKKLESFRQLSGVLQDLSFDTIMGSGSNGAIIHYRVSDASNRTIRNGELLLVDSGAQYLDGTTDVTRTIAIGAPSDDMRQNFTRVLKGHIAIAQARFPTGTTGATLDALARQALWSAGLDYDHGTGHGVGSYLSVHEGPQGISRLATKVELRAGMILSNEPGYYRADEYGIRIENLIIVTEAAAIKGGERDMHGFETTTLAPIDRNLVDRSLLRDDEIAWLNDYHARVRSELTPLLDGNVSVWLERATEPL